MSRAHGVILHNFLTKPLSKRLNFLSRGLLSQVKECAQVGHTKHRIKISGGGVKYSLQTVFPDLRLGEPTLITKNCLQTAVIEHDFSNSTH
jgi:hypothetical protein